MEQNKKRFTVTLDPDLADEAQKCASKNDRSFSYLVNSALRDRMRVERKKAKKQPLRKAG